MSYLLKTLLLPAYRYVTNPREREFFRLMSKWGGVDRYQQVENVGFLDFVFTVPDFTSFVWQYREIFVDEVYKMNINRNDPVIFDCGANIGMSCAYFKRSYLNAKIKAFEADSRIANILEQNLFRNKIHDVEIINKAVWINNDGVSFGADGADGGSIFLKGDDIRVTSTRLKEHILNEPRIDFLKIDIEGAEYEVLVDCQDSLSNVERIFIEYHSWNCHAQKLSEILAILEHSGFRYYIEGVGNRKSPLVNHARDGSMDLQLNIFGYKE